MSRQIDQHAGLLAVGVAFALVLSCWLDGTLFPPPSVEEMLELQHEREAKRIESWRIDNHEFAREEGGWHKEKEPLEENHRDETSRESNELEGLRVRLHATEQTKKSAFSSLLKTEDSLISRLLTEEIHKLEEDIGALNLEIQRLEEIR